MRLRFILGAAATILALGRHGVTAGTAPADPLAVGSEAQLFVDDFLIESQANLVRTLHSPRKDNEGNAPVIALGGEYNGIPAMLNGNGSIVFDSRLKKYVMFAEAIATSAALPPAELRRVYRFTSRDGLAWTKGDDGRPQRVDFDLRDPDGRVSGRALDLFSCYYDTSDQDTPYKGWLYIYEGKAGIYYVASHDGINWGRGRLVILHAQILRARGENFFGPEDVTLFSRDEPNHRFLGLFKFYTRPPSYAGVRSRAFAFLDRIDQPIDLARIGRVDLVPAKKRLNGDEPADQYYACTAWHYGALWLGGLKIWHGSGNYPFSAAGSAFLKLIASRDGLHWKKVPYRNEAGQPEVFIPNGTEGGNGGRNDGGYICEFSQGPMRIGDQLIYYYGSSSWGKNWPTGKRLTGGGVFRSRLRPDGFVSVDSGTLTTKLIAFSGRRLFLNATGPVRVDVLDGGTVRGSGKIEGDSLSEEIRFRNRNLSDCAGGSQTRLRFTVEPGGRLYSFSIH